MDRISFIGIIALTLVFVILLGGQIYVGLWYNLVIPISIVILMVFIKPAPIYLTGEGLEIFASYLHYCRYNLAAVTTARLLGPGRVFSLDNGWWLSQVTSRVDHAGIGKRKHCPAAFMPIASAQPQRSG